MTDTREYPQVRESERLESRLVLPPRSTPDGLIGWVSVLVVVAAAVLVAWLLPSESKMATPDHGEPVTLEEFAPAGNLLVRDPQVAIPGASTEEVAPAGDVLTRSLLPEAEVALTADVPGHEGLQWCNSFVFEVDPLPCLSQAG